MKKKIVIIASAVLLSVIVAVSTVSAIEAYKEENTTFLASSSRSETVKKNLRM